MKISLRVGNVVMLRCVMPNDPSNKQKCRPFAIVGELNGKMVATPISSSGNSNEGAAKIGVKDKFQVIMTGNQLKFKGGGTKWDPDYKKSYIVANYVAMLDKEVELKDRCFIPWIMPCQDTIKKALAEVIHAAKVGKTSEVNRYSYVGKAA